MLHGVHWTASRELDLTPAPATASAGRGPTGQRRAMIGQLTAKHVSSPCRPLHRSTAPMARRSRHGSATPSPARLSQPRATSRPCSSRAPRGVALLRARATAGHLLHSLASSTAAPQHSWLVLPSPLLSPALAGGETSPFRSPAPPSRHTPPSSSPSSSRAPPPSRTPYPTQRRPDKDSS